MNISPSLQRERERENITCVFVSTVQSVIHAGQNCPTLQAHAGIISSPPHNTCVSTVTIVSTGIILSYNDHSLLC